MRRVTTGLVALILVVVSACADAPEPGDLDVFCDLLEEGTGLDPTPLATDLEKLVLVAPPAVRPTIEALQNRAQDFNELLAMDPPNLEALFNARFDPAARGEQEALDNYAESSCGLTVDRPPASRWNNYVRDNFADAEWGPFVTAQFDVAGDTIDTATMVFADTPNPVKLVEDVCSAVSEFLISDGANPGRVRVLVGTVVDLNTTHPPVTASSRSVEADLIAVSFDLRCSISTRSGRYDRSNITPEGAL